MTFDFTDINTNRLLILNFDGVICNLFKNTDLQEVKEEMRYAMRKFGVTYDTNDNLFTAYSAISHLYGTDRRRNALPNAMVGTILDRTEWKAVDSAEDIAGAAEFIADYFKAGGKIGIATNNSEACVYKWLQMHDLDHLPITVSGRVNGNPHLLKPNPKSIKEIIAIEITLLDWGRYEDTIVIGNTKRDKKSAELSDVNFIGFAPDASSDVFKEEKTAKNYLELTQLLKEENDYGNTDAYCAG